MKQTGLSGCFHARGFKPYLLVAAMEIVVFIVGIGVWTFIHTPCSEFPAKRRIFLVKINVTGPLIINQRGFTPLRIIGDGFAGC